MTVPGILKDGPHHGRVIHVEPGHPVICTAATTLPPGSESPTAIYRLTDETRPDGKLVYRYEGTE